MQTKDLIELVLHKFKESQGYAEMGEDKLKNSIKDCLNIKYRRELDDALERLNDKKKKGNKVNEQDYEREQMRVEENVIYAAQLLAATTHEDLQNLV